jgi:hypothetical protein
MRRLLVVLLLASCAGKQPVPQPPAGPSFRAAAETFLEEYLRFRPATAVKLGRHDHDGEVADRSAQAFDAERKRLAEAEEIFQAFDPAKLSRDERLERASILGRIREERFDLVDRRWPQQNPQRYLQELDLSQYILRPYGEPAHWGKAMLSVCRAAPRHLTQAAQNLDEEVPGAFIGFTSQNIAGTITFLKTDVTQVAGRIDDVALRDELLACLGEMVTALEGYRAALQGKKPSMAYALGAERFSRMLADTQGIDVPLARLKELAEADLARNLASLEEAAKEIDPRRPVDVVVLEAAQDKPAPDQVIAEATEQAKMVLRFAANRLVTFPTDQLPLIRETPVFMRFNIAFLSSAGTLETLPRPSYYFITPPDPTWPPAEQQAYVLSRPDLLFVTIHEVWPGHYLQDKFIERQKSAVLRSLCSYATTEGWAHYTEEMMWDEGVADKDPRAHIGQLKMALMRDVRFLAAIGLHTEGMTVEQATALFRDKAFLDPAGARQQAMRGTLDPMYLNYTVGKLAIMKLRTDWKKGASSLKEFHDTFLSHGCAPLPAIRAEMIGAGEIL